MWNYITERDDPRLLCERVVKGDKKGKRESRGVGDQIAQRVDINGPERSLGNKIIKRGKTEN